MLAQFAQALSVYFLTVGEKENEAKQNVVNADHLPPAKTEQVSMQAEGRSESEMFSVLIPIISSDENPDQVRDHPQITTI